MLRKAKVLVTGGTGFLGQHLCRELDKYGAFTYSAGKGLDLTWSPCVEQLFGHFSKPDYVFHLAGHNGGIAYNDAFPADIFFKNTIMGLNVLEACQRHKVKKVVSVVASCAYPEYGFGYLGGFFPREIMEEHAFLDGETHASVACHGYAKRNLQLASSFYRKQYGLEAVCACPTTLYGPGDSYDPQRTKVMGGLIKRFVDAADNGSQSVTCWGTGSPMREFLYVEDAAKLLVETMLHYGDSDIPLNLGSGQEYSIKDTANMVASRVVFNGEIHWDSTKPDGQYRKRLDTTRMNEILPRIEFTTLEQGIDRTIADYRARSI